VPNSDIHRAASLDYVVSSGKQLRRLRPAQNPPSVGDGLPIILAPSEILSSLDRLGGGWVDPVFEEEAQHFPRGVRSSPISE